MAVLLAAMVSASSTWMKSSTNWAGIVMGARLFIPKVVFAFSYFLFPVLSFFIFVSSAACAFLVSSFLLLLLLHMGYASTKCLCLRAEYEIFLFLFSFCGGFYKSFFFFFFTYYTSTHILRILFVNFIFIFWVEW